MELVIKAVIAQRLEVGHDLGQVTKVPANHNVPHLWVIAGLPQLPPEDSGRLVIARVYLMWANRYPAPNRDEDGYRDDADLWRRAHVPVGAAGNLKRRVSFAWDDVNRLYKIADRSIWDIRKCAGLSD
ncbi:hypothetical protein ACM42_02380 [Bradyrhizobium sp. CCBAU 25338]|nr:hypothetical protein [Bradyrhizobium sp. CCBAU 45389]MDA9527301.1 hypothetical protein [Bradyrhizobium sp. CCBAU 25338]RXH33395.1 hypothetical protein XH84_10085 [Bradyrhizobium nanningense]